MNRFRVNLHPAFFDPEKRYTKEQIEEAKSFLKEFKEEEDVLQKEIISRNNEALASATKVVETKEEIEQTEGDVEKQLETQLKQLAKNKKIDLPWTDNAWKCSRAEKRLATSSAKVFMQLLEHQQKRASNTEFSGPTALQEVINQFKEIKGGEFTEEIFNKWSWSFGEKPFKLKDIQRFYKAYQEYQNPQSQFQHLRNLMGFLLENDFENDKAVRDNLNTRSERISKHVIREKWKDMNKPDNNQENHDNSDETTTNKPKDWKERASFEVIKERLSSKSIGQTDKMLTLLGDFNLDGEVNSGDVGYKTGSQFVDVFRRTVATKHLEDEKFNDDTAVKNLVEYANKFGMDIKKVQNVANLYAWMTGIKGYENTKQLQNFLKNLPIELGDVLENGANAGKQSLDRMMSAIGLEKKEEAAAKTAAEGKAIEIVSAGEARLREVIKDDRERADITQQLLAQLPGMLLDKAMGEKIGLGIGYGKPLNEIIAGLSAGFNIGIGTDGKPKFGLFVGWDKKYDLSKTTDLRIAASESTKLLFVPCSAASMELDQDLNKGSRDKSLDAKGEQRFTLGGNVTVVPGVFSWGVNAGFENNKQKGIEKQAQNINSVVKEQAKSWVESIKLAEDKKASLREALKKEFPKTSDKELDDATNNLLSIIQQFKIDEKSTDQDFDTYAQIIADVYSEQWRNAALAGIADNKRKISGGKVGIQFIAGCIPVTSLVVKFTNDRNARTNETEHSKVARIDAQFNGKGNGENILDNLNAKEIGTEQVTQINAILKRYGAKSNLEYVEGEDGKPGRIKVPASLSDGIGINVRVSKEMKGYVKDGTTYIDGDSGIQHTPYFCYQFPANATYRILQETGGNQRSITLNIGSDKSSSEDVLISERDKMDALCGPNELMGGKKWQDKEAKNSGFEIVSNQLSMLSDIEVALRDMDTDNRKAFSEFTETKTQAKGDFEQVVKSFTDALNSSPKIDAATKKAFIDKFNALGNEDKQLIIDRVISIAAYYEDVHNEDGLQKRIDARVKRGDKYKTLTGPNGKEIFSGFGKDYRSEVVNDLKGGSYASESMPNILGATAFYNKRLDNEAKGLGTTGLGVTTVLGGKTVKLDENDAPKAKEWFLGEHGILKKEPNEWNNLKNIIRGKLPDWAQDKLGDSGLKKILLGEEVEINLDNSEKKAKIKLEDVKYVFYLMGECANESVGMELGDISITENEEVDTYGKGALYLNNGDGSSSVGVEEKNAAVGAGSGGGKKDGQPEEPGEPDFDAHSNNGNNNLKDPRDPGTTAGQTPGQTDNPLGGGFGGGTPGEDNSSSGGVGGLD